MLYPHQIAQSSYAILHAHLPRWVEQAYQRRRFQRAIHAAYMTWMARFPRWANAGFDEYFLRHDAWHLRAQSLIDGQQPDAVALARQWAAAYHLDPKRTQQAILECAPVAAHFISLLQVEVASHRPGAGRSAANHLAV